MKKSYTLKTLAEILQCEYQGNPNKEVTGFDDLKTATEEEVSFLANSRYLEAMKQSHAGIICVSFETEKDPHKNYLISENPSFVFQQVINLFFDRENHSSGFHAIHPSAVIHPSVKIGPNVKVGPFVSLDKGVEIGEGSVLTSHISVGAGAKIGKNCLIHPQVTIREGCILHNRVIIQPGVVIGSCGYGYQTTKEKTHIKLEQIGVVILEDDVEIGANTTIDRARFKATVIKCGTKIDNLVQIGHNVEVGRHNLIVSQTGIAGSTKVGDHVIMGGQCGIVGHIEIASHTVLTTRSGVSKSIDKPAIYGGSPIMPLNEYNRQQVLLRNIDSLNKKIKNIEDKLSELKDLSKT